MKVLSILIMVVIATLVVSLALYGFAKTVSSFDAVDAFNFEQWLEEVRNELDDGRFQDTFASIPEGINPVTSMMRQISIATTEITNASFDNVFFDGIHRLINPFWLIIDNLYGGQTIFDFVQNAIDRIFDFFG